MKSDGMTAFQAPFVCARALYGCVYVILIKCRHAVIDAGHFICISELDTIFSDGTCRHWLSLPSLAGVGKSFQSPGPYQAPRPVQVPRDAARSSCAVNPELGEPVNGSHLALLLRQPTDQLVTSFGSTSKASAKATPSQEKIARQENPPQPARPTTRCLNPTQTTQLRHAALR